MFLAACTADAFSWYARTALNRSVISIDWVHIGIGHVTGEIASGCPGS